MWIRCICLIRRGTDNSASRNTATVETTGERDENSATEIWPDCSIDAPIEKN